MKAVLAATLAVLLVPSTGLATLVAGDIAFVGYNADGGDDFAIVTLVNLTNTTLFFSDNEPSESGGLNDTNEGVLAWDTGATTIIAGTIITFDNFAMAGRSASTGTLTSSSGSANFAATGDALYAYTGSSISPDVFLAAIAADNFGLVTTGTLSNAGLAEGVNAIEFSTTGADGGVYTGPRDTLSSFAAYLPLINDPANWTVESSNGENLIPFSTMSFVAVPEPTAALFASLLTAGLGLTVARRKSRD